MFILPLVLPQGSVLVVPGSGSRLARFRCRIVGEHTLDDRVLVPVGSRRYCLVKQVYLSA